MKFKIALLVFLCSKLIRNNLFLSLSSSWMVLTSPPQAKGG